MSTIFKLENVELMWPFLYERNKLSGKYQVDVINLERNHHGEALFMEVSNRTIRCQHWHC
jgi:hypothetical protein